MFLKRGGALALSVLLIAGLFTVPVSAVSKQEIDPDTKVVSKATAYYTRASSYVCNYTSTCMRINIRMQWSANGRGYDKYTGIIPATYSMAYGLHSLKMVYSGNGDEPLYQSAGTPYATLGTVSFTTAVVSPYISTVTVGKHGELPGICQTRTDGDDDLRYDGQTHFANEAAVDAAIQQLKSYDFNEVMSFKTCKAINPDFKTLELQNCITRETLRLSAVPVTINGGNYSGAPALRLASPIDLIQNIQGSFLSI